MLTTLRRASILAVLLGAATAPPAEAGELTAFAAHARPDTVWQPGFGATLGVGILGLGAGEIEAARFSGDLAGNDLTSVSASAMIAPSIGAFVPFAGIGVGVYRQNIGNESVTNVLGALAIGLKFNVGGMLVLRGEYRRFDLSRSRLVMDDRFSVGAGIQF